MDGSRDTHVNARHSQFVSFEVGAQIPITLPYAQRGLQRRALQRIEAYLEQRLGDGITVDALAAVACMSRFHFSRLFRTSTGESPMQYVRRLRVERAKTLLAQGGLTMAEIAAAAGFFDQSHFSRCFKQIVGRTPSEYAHALPLPDRPGADRRSTPILPERARRTATTAWQRTGLSDARAP